MNGYVHDIHSQSNQNRDFRRVVYTGSRLQLVLMSLRPGEEIGEEVHEDIDQFFRVESGEGEVTIDGRKVRVAGGCAFLVPAGARHNVANVATVPLKLTTLYGPPQHEDGTVHRTKRDALASHEHFSGTSSE
jgi:mannose-6-phosphate isomerase-like protein (cupin superfamily)